MSRNCVCQYNLAGDFDPARRCLRGTVNGALFCAAHYIGGVHQEALAEADARRRARWPFWPQDDVPAASVPVPLVKPALTIEDAVLSEVLV
ncbi:MAG: hypothetical protein NTY77_05440 [Elusimicrobia bacterium]|nr:hypothetical protein [Elusimicrobiota bacterium]